MTRKSPLKGFIHDLFLGKSQGTFTYYSINNMHNNLKNQFNTFQIYFCASQVLLVVKSLPVDAGDIKEAGLIPGSRKSLGGRFSALPGESHGQRSLAGYNPWGLKESDTTKVT